MPKIETLESLVESPYYPRDDKQLEAAKRAIEKALPRKLRSKKMPPRVKADVQWLSGLLKESRWKKKKGVDAIVAAGLLYLLNGKDSIPDKVQVIGYFDDSIVLDVVIRSIQIGVAK
ncbi:MAG: hypothetical protein FD180_2567 [Planctomycetota bacterium]|nr:MAG: hypothetical protein FD180_2567 [Planctomycetota bacterium]